MFFAVNSKTINYVGTYLGKNEFVHVEPAKGVIRTEIGPFYKNAFAYGKRVLGNIPPEEKGAKKTESAETPKADCPEAADIASHLCKRPGSIAESLSGDELNGLPAEVWEKMLAESKKYIGTPYKHEIEKKSCKNPKNKKTCTTTKSTEGIDCSGFIYSVFKRWAEILNQADLVLLAKGQSCGATSCPTQAEIGHRVPKADGKGAEVFKNLKIGDIIFFSIEENWREKKGNRQHRPGDAPSHVGLYIGNGQMIHSGTSGGVAIVKLDAWENYWADYFIYGGRMFEWKNGKLEILK